jgi:sporulation protein YlmC with PRC-barrel domain
VDDAEDRSQNPYTALEGYMVLDDAGAEVGEVEETVYDAVSDVLKYLSVNGHAVLADRIEVDHDAELVRVPYDGETVESAPVLRETSGAFDDALRAHYGEPAG